MTRVRDRASAENDLDAGTDDTEVSEKIGGATKAVFAFDVFEVNSIDVSAFVVSHILTPG